MSQIFMVFSKFELKKSNEKFLQNLKLLSGVANLASKCDCLIAFNFPDVRFLNSF